MIDKDRNEGSARQMKGKLKEAAGRLTGDEKLRQDGKGESLRGRFRTR